MTLYEICSEVAQIEEGLAYGEIEFVYGKLASAMKPGHPADLLDDVLSMIGWDVFADKEVEIERVKEWQNALKEFKKCFKIKELAAPIRHIDTYIKEQEEQ